MLNVALIIQGEGFGHVTQAITISEYLKRSDHYNLRFCVYGSPKKFSLPPILRDSIEVPIYKLVSPGLIYNQKSKNLSISKTLAKAIVNMPAYISSVLTVRELCSWHSIDIVINLYEVIGGLYSLWHNRSKRMVVSISHQYFLNSRHFAPPPGRKIQKVLFHLNNKLTSFRSDAIFALSYAQTKNADDHVICIPPLIRDIVKESSSKKGDFILAYANQEYMVEELKEWQEKKFPMETIHCFCKTSMNKPKQVSSNFYLYPINSNKFIELMTQCKLLITSAGFESSCEAILLHKPVAVIPIKGHYEQLCNSIDLKRVKAGIAYSRIEDIDVQDTLDTSAHDLLNWLEQSEKLFIQSLNQVYRRHLKKLNSSTEDFFKILKKRVKAMWFNGAEFTN